MTDDTFFDPHQRATIAAAMARMIPTDDAPGAAEAGTIDFLDRYLSGPGYVYATPDGSGFETLTGRRLDAWTRRIELVRERYVAGVEALDAAARTRGADFVDLDPEAQDDVLREVERPEGREEEADLARARSPSTARPWRRHCSRPAPRSTSGSSRCSPCTPARASTPTRSTAATGATSAGR